MLEIYIDADGCAVKDETYKVSERHQLKVFVVANQWLKIPLSPRIEMSVVSGGFDAADDWIVEHAGPGLADGCEELRGFLPAARFKREGRLFADANLRAAVETRAAIDHTTTSDVIRKALRRYLDVA